MYIWKRETGYVEVGLRYFSSAAKYDSFDAEAKKRFGYSYGFFIVHIGWKCC